MVRELGLPRGAILINLRRGPTMHVPGATSLLEAGDPVTVLIAPDAAAAVATSGRE
jgi:hypothetical protein